jgi:hypothetical protein
LQRRSRCIVRCSAQPRVHLAVPLARSISSQDGHRD